MRTKIATLLRVTQMTYSLSENTLMPLITRYNYTLNGQMKMEWKLIGKNPQ